MIIGHLPAGYVVANLLFPRLRPSRVSRNVFIGWGILGSIAPDLDMFYFHLIDHRQHHHHTYFTHYPVVWLSLLLVSILWLRVSKTSKGAVLAMVFTLEGFIHMILDTIVGDIWWFAPAIDKPFALATVPALYKPWWLNFLFHWSFAIEIAIIGYAVYLWRRRTQNRA